MSLKDQNNLLDKLKIGIILQIIMELSLRDQQYQIQYKLTISLFRIIKKIFIYNQQQMEKHSMDDIMQRPVIGVHPINICNIHEAKDGGSCKFESKFIKTFYLDGNGNDSGYYVPGGNFLSFQMFAGGHQLWLDNFEFKKGMVYTLSYWLRTNINKNSWNSGKGKISSQKAMFNINCREFVPGMLQVGNTVLSLTVNDHTPALQKYVSSPYKAQEDKLVSIIIHPWLYDRNGFLWDIAYPEIQWRSMF